MSQQQASVPAVSRPAQIEEWRQAAAVGPSELALHSTPKMQAFIESVEDLDLYTRPTKRPRWWRRWFGSGTLRFVATYMALPFVTGVMAGMGEIFANELMYRWGWQGARPIMLLPNFRAIFASFRTDEEERSFRNSAILRFAGFVAACAVMSVVAT
ncbi:hypothetical protein IWW55_001756, partial [Coemansia sp. RSA 2706]